MRNSDWWRPENLIRIQGAFNDDIGRHNPDARTDFGSYRLLLEGATPDTSQIGIHNDVQPLAKVRAIARILGHQNPQAILDAGCGAGFTTEALTVVYPQADVLGVDLAVDAIAYATRTHSRARFIAAPIAIDSPPLGSFDLIFCFEFYPFTRNTDAPTQAAFVRSFVEQLRPGGALIIYQTWKNPNSLAQCYDEVRTLTPELHYAKRRTPHAKLAARLPLRAAQALSWMASTLAGKDWQKPIVIVTRQSQAS
jgi:SAM-dependent methyltransferase